MLARKVVPVPLQVSGCPAFRPLLRRLLLPR